MAEDDEDDAGTPPADMPLASVGGSAALYDRLVAVGFTGPDFDVVAGRLIRYAYPVLRAWIISGQIIKACAATRVRGVRQLAARFTVPSREDAEDLVQETVVAGLQRFRRDGRNGTGWSPDGGASLSTYFVTACVISFKDVYESWENGERRHRSTSSSLSHDAPTGNDPADIVVHREEIAKILPPQGRVRTAVLLDAEGYSYAEIAQMVGGGTTARAVEGWIHRYRKKNKKKLRGGGKL